MSPRKPDVVNHIRSVSVKGGFLNGVHLDFSASLNCLIGGRGTGKTTMLELIRYALKALPTERNGEGQRLAARVKENLAGGRVEVEFQTRNRLTYIISRAWDEEPIVLTADRRATQLAIRECGFFSADIFSQNEMEQIADRSSSQLVLIDKFRSGGLGISDSGAIAIVATRFAAKV